MKQKKFNKGLSAEDIKFYGKIHFDRDRSENSENNMHCHLIVSRKDQSNKIKLSPLTNHKNTKKGTVKGGFDRSNLFQNVEKGFDNLFNYGRPLTESFEYYNIMKNGSISEQLRMQEKKINVAGEKEKVQIDITESANQSKTQSTNTPDLGMSSTLGILATEVHGKDAEELKKYREIEKEERKRKMGLSR